MIESAIGENFRELLVRTLWGALGGVPHKEKVIERLDECRAWMKTLNPTRKDFLEFEYPERLCIEWVDGMMVLPELIVYLLPDNFVLDTREATVKRKNIQMDEKFFSMRGEYGIIPFRDADREAVRLCKEFLESPGMPVGNEEVPLSPKVVVDRNDHTDKSREFVLSTNFFEEVTIYSNGDVWFGAEGGPHLSLEQLQLLYRLAENIKNLYINKY